MGLLTIFPRFLDNYNFYISYDLSEEKLIEVCAHEILHFIWFKKFKELYSDIDRKEYDNPYIPWIYSEMVVDPILNSKDIKKILGINAKAYDYFYNEEDIYKIKDIFNTNNTIEDKIKLGYEYLKNKVE